MNIHKILANAVVLAGFVAVPFIPFIVLSHSTFFPFIVGKNFAFRIIVEIMLSAWLVLAFIDPAYRPRKSYLLGVFVAFLGIITLSAIFGENPTKSFWSNFERMEGVVTYFHLFAYFIVASTVLTVRGFWRPYLNLHLFAGVIMAIYGVLQWSGGLDIVQDGMRVNGTLGNAAYLGTYALFNIFLAGFFMARESFTTTGERARVAIYGAIILLQTFVLYHTATRGAMLGLLAGIGLSTLLVAIFEREKKILRNGAIGVLFATALFVGGFIAMRDAQFVKDSPVLSRFAAISFTEQTTKSRFMVWNMAYQGFKERPVLGWGMENFNYVFNKYYNPKMYDQEQWFDRAHNVFFDWLIAGGLPALFAYISLFACAIYCIWRRADELSIVEKSVLTGLLGGYFFQNLFVFDNITSLIYFGTILAYIEGMSRASHESIKSVKFIKSKGDADAEDLTFIVSGSAIIIALVLVYTVNYKGVMQNTTLIRAMSDRSAGPARNLELFKETIAYDSFGTSEAREQLAQLSMNGFDPSKGVSEIQSQFISLAGNELERQAKKLSKDARYQVFAGSFFSRVGDSERAISYLEKSVELSPNKQTILFELGSAYYNSKNIEKAEEAFKRAYELEPKYDMAQKYYAQVLMASGKRVEAEKIMGVQSTN
ncbi:MAG: hypothetical protein UU88_C0002G0046 [Parcubacteria group bacterium GW2011_GWC1_42_11]|nr:MAG: hypothetical protein UU88_C0002G0046 [Parcubacteria group bacterium GW2011_GWC1_42_11]KKT09710.1 MAG: hypothetical protein UV86_C0003G0046 [Candidatus Nomurabacteria bacterium GW2011_GWB1_43_20]TAN36649.1 MAG: tetratricopeptide repeat protein [Patescibacteria group bacterium]HBH71669.1 hypothetical protein [Candidatus Yonathbacteria bacterium]